MSHTNPRTRRGFLAAVATASVAGCSAREGDADTTTLNADTTNAGTTTTRPTSTTAAGADSPPLADSTLPLPMAPDALAERAVSGGPPKDGIPSIDAPTFEDATAADDRLADHDVVFGLVRSGVAKAYPQYILVWHEIVNDAIDGDPISVTYCPLTGTALGFERGDTTFGVSGRLVNNNLIMYDRATEQWWPQVLSTAIPSPWYDDYQRRSLRDFRVVWTTWGRWRDRHPETRVMTEDTGTLRNYGNDPYGSYGPTGPVGYYAAGRPPMFASFSDSDRFEPKHVVLGARTPDGAAAFSLSALREHRLLEGAIGSTSVLAVYEPRLDTGYVYRNPDDRSVEHRDGRYEDPSGSIHAADSLPLEGVHAIHAMWFAWNGFYPEANVYG